MTKEIQQSSFVQISDKWYRPLRVRCLDKSDGSIKVYSFADGLEHITKCFKVSLYTARNYLLRDKVYSNKTHSFSLISLDEVKDNTVDDAIDACDILMAGRKRRDANK